MKILFINPATSRTGAPLVLLHLLTWIKSNKPNVELCVLSLSGGDLENEFRLACKKFYNLEEFANLDSSSFIRRLLIKTKLVRKRNKLDRLVRELGKEKFNLIYSNTVKSIPFGQKIKIYTPNAKHVAHIHELNVIIRQLLPEFKRYIDNIDKIIVPSNLVLNSLISDWGVPEMLVERVYECADVMKEFEVPSNKENFIIGGSGTVHWRKGYDLFIQVASIVHERLPNEKIQFIWAGKLYPLEKLIIDEELEKLGLKAFVDFIGELDNPIGVYNSFDLFLMTSREDPFPLVCIEVGSLGKPIISFDRATGSNEIIKGGGGFIVPYIDVNGMAEKVILYYENRDLLSSHGRINAIEFSHFKPEIICPELFRIIENQLI